METNKDLFVSHGYLINSTPEKLEVQISNSGDAARYRSTVRWSSRGTVVSQGKWQEIRYNKRNARPYIMMQGRRLYIDRFVRNNSPWA